MPVSLLNLNKNRFGLKFGPSRLYDFCFYVEEHKTEVKLLTVFM